MEHKEIWKNSTIKIIAAAIVMAIIMMIFQPVIGFIALITIGILSFYYYRQLQEEEKKFMEHMENLSEIFDSATKHAIFNMPFPLVILENNGDILWYNTPFIDMTKSNKLIGMNIDDVVTELEIEDYIKHGESTTSQSICYGNKSYLVYGNVVDLTKTNTNREEILVLYWVDDTKSQMLQQRLDQETVSVLIVVVDNYDEVKSNSPETVRPLVLAEIDKTINTYFHEHHAIVRKYENDKYQVVIENLYLRELIGKRFDILDTMRELSIGNTIPITLSIGISSMDEEPLEAYREALASVEVALGRGGDQAVLRQGNGYQFFGGKTKAVEKRNKVKARVIADALRQLIDQATDVYIMGHKNADMDAIGAAIGVWRAVTNRNIEGYIVLNESNPSIDLLMRRLDEKQPKLKSRLIKSEEALGNIREDSLLILVDNHKPSFTEEPLLLEETEQVVVIDHHRRGSEFVKNPVLTYIEPYASSTCELVTEVLTYMSDEHNLTVFEAEALMAGITVDTKDFSFQTGVRTFEAASTLKRAGADMSKVKQLFQDDMETVRQKSKVLEGAEIIFDEIALGKLEETRDDSILIAAKAADELLYVDGVVASFVLAKLEDAIHISGRSLGSISVQLILEKLGGGGHLTSAGVQLKAVTIEEAAAMLRQAISDYLEEGKDKKQ